MSETTIREVVGHFDHQADFQQAVDSLLAAGFARTDLSVLGSHDSLEVAEAAKSPFASWLAGLTGEVKYIGPLATAGFIAMASGPVGLLISGLVVAGVGGMAVKELLDDITAAEHTEWFSHAFERGGVILWADVGEDKDRRAAAERLMAEAGGDRIHLNERRVRG